MKRNITILSLVVVSAMAFTACQKDDNGFVTLNVELGDYSNNSKMYVDAERYTHWTSGDKININDRYNPCSVDLTGEKAQIKSVIIDSCYQAVYPAGLATANFNSATSTSIAVSLPSIQTYSVDNNDHQIISAPMYGYCSSDQNTLVFHNLCSLLKVTINNNRNEAITMQKITLKASLSNRKLSGSGNIKNLKTGSPYLELTSSGNNYVTLDFTGCNEIVSSQDEKSYYIVVPSFSTTDINITVEAIGAGEMTIKKTRNNAVMVANILAVGPTVDMGDAVITFMGSGTVAAPFLINGLADLNTLKTRVEAGNTYAGKYFELEDDISCGSWSGMGTASNYFCGTLDGNNNTISYSQTNTSSYNGLFKYLGTAVIKNLKVSCTINNTGASSYAGYCGGIAGVSYGTTFIDDTVITGSSISGSGRYYGGITGSTGNAAVTITRCHSYANIESTQTNDMLYIGGIAGYVAPSGSRVEYSSASGTIKGTNGDYIGGIVGALNSGCTVDNCTFTGTVTGKDGATNTGTYVGYNKGTVTNCPPPAK